MKKALIFISILLICMSQVFCLNNSKSIIPDGSYLTLEDERLLYLYFDNEIEGFAFCYGLVGEDDEINYVYLYGDFDRSIVDDNDYTLLSYTEDGEYAGPLSTNIVPTTNGLKITIGSLGIIASELDRVSKKYMSLDEIRTYITENNLKLKTKTTPISAPSRYSKELNGTYILHNKERLAYLFIDKDTEGFIFYDENIQSGDYRVYFGTISQSLTDEKKYTLYSYNADYTYAGALQMTSVFRNTGIKITINQLRVVSWEMEKISNNRMRLNEISDLLKIVRNVTYR